MSASEQEAQRLRAAGPRRDFDELAAAVNGELIYQGSGARRRGRLGRLFGPHIRQAWAVAGRVRPRDVVFVDGEHVGIPLLLFLALRRREPERVVFIGHALWSWKQWLLGLVTRMGARGRVIVHSTIQARAIAPRLGKRWDVRVVPYQVDTRFWSPDVAPQSSEDVEPLVLAVGSEYRDYDVLLRAARGLPARFEVAAGSHWARFQQRADSVPANVEFLTEPLPFGQLRERYARAAVVVVPLQPIANQAGVTTILEAMSMALPVIVTATEGQLECVRGPLVRADSSLDSTATAQRGPQLFFGDLDRAAPDDGLYVPVGDAAALRAAIRRLLDDHELASDLGVAARASTERHFTVEQFAQRFAAAILDDGPEPAPTERESRR